MAETDLSLRCMRCGSDMELRDRMSGGTWASVQYWVCPQCGRHFWTTYPPAGKEKPATGAAAPSGGTGGGAAASAATT